MAFLKLPLFENSGIKRPSRVDLGCVRNIFSILAAKYSTADSSESPVSASNYKGAIYRFITTSKLFL